MWEPNKQFWVFCSPGIVVINLPSTDFQNPCVLRIHFLEEADFLQKMYSNIHTHITFKKPVLWVSYMIIGLCLYGRLTFNS